MTRLASPMCTKSTCPAANTRLDGHALERTRVSWGMHLESAAFIGTRTSRAAPWTALRPQQVSDAQRSPVVVVGPGIECNFAELGQPARVDSGDQTLHGWAYVRTEN